MKYAMGLDPTMAEPGGASLATGMDTNNDFQVLYTRPNPPAVDVNYQLEVSGDLANWSTNLAGFSQRILFGGSNYETVVYQMQAASGCASNEFLRLSVSEQ
jgi:hypothetical protein